MADENDFQPRPGRIRSTRSQRAKPFVAQALAAAQRAGGGVSRQGLLRSGRRSTFGRGRAASVRANHLLTGRSRLVTVKTRVVRHTARAAPLAAHLGYLRREGVTRDGEKARLFGPETEDADPKAFAERGEKDRHHFRFIVSPEDAPEMADLKGFTRELVGQMEKDLGTKLDWVAVDHWNTQHPHVHIIVRGVADDGQDLVISRDYIKEGMRARAQDLVTQELGLRSDLDIRRALERQVDAERQARGIVFVSGLIGTLRRREVEALGERLAAETGQPFNGAATGEYVAGTYRQRFALASGRVAMIDDGLGFQLVPWTPSLEKQLGRHVSGVARDDGGIDWGFGRNRGLGL